jgi:hypothetical protein
MARDETIVGGRRFDTDRDGRTEMRKYAGRWPNRVWAIGKARRRVAAELIGDLERFYRRSRQADKELKVLVIELCDGGDVAVVEVDRLVEAPAQGGGVSGEHVLPGDLALLDL